MTSADPSVVACRAVCRAYRSGGSEVPALRQVDLDLARGSFTAIVGPSGSGKSTLLRLIGCLDVPDTGTVTIDGVTVSGLSTRRRARVRSRAIGYLFQTPADNLLDYLTVRQHLRLGAQMRGARRGADVDAFLDQLGITARATHLPRQLSGGEQQRLAIAFAAIGDPLVVVADEPTGQLGRGHADAVVAALRGLAGRGTTVVAATHDPVVWRHADRALAMRDGRLADRQPA